VPHDTAEVKLVLGYIGMLSDHKAYHKDRLEHLW